MDFFLEEEEGEEDPQNISPSVNMVELELAKEGLGSLLLNYAHCFQMRERMDTVKEILKTKLLGQFKSEAELVGHKMLMLNHVAKALFPNFDELNKRFDVFKNKQTKTLTADQNAEKEVLKRVRRNMKQTSERFFASVIALYKSAQPQNTFVELVKTTSGKKKTPSPMEELVNLSPPYRIVVCG